MEKPDAGHLERRGGKLIPGSIQRMSLRGYPDSAYYVYVPTRVRRPDRLFVTVHGISRNARRHAELFADRAEREGVVLVAPLFDRLAFPGYQRLGASADRLRADQALDRMVSEVGAHPGLVQRPRLSLFGYSGGGQFVHRYLMSRPHGIHGAVIGAAGWYTFPTRNAAFPRGMRTAPDDHWQAVFPDFLHVPVTVVVGEDDRHRDDVLNTSRLVDRQQGGNRFERGRRWVRAMAHEAHKRGFLTRYRFVGLPGIGHSFEQAMRDGGLGEFVFARLFEAQEASPPATAVRQSALP